MEFIEYCISKTGASFGRFQFMASIALLASAILDMGIFIYYYDYFKSVPDLFVSIAALASEDPTLSDLNAKEAE